MRLESQWLCWSIACVKALVYLRGRAETRSFFPYQHDQTGLLSFLLIPWGHKQAEMFLREPCQRGARHRAVFILFLKTFNFAINFPQSFHTIKPLFSFSLRGAQFLATRRCQERRESGPCLLSFAKGWRDVLMPWAGSQVPFCANSKAVFKYHCSQERNARLSSKAS